MKDLKTLKLVEMGLGLDQERLVPAPVGNTTPRLSLGNVDALADQLYTRVTENVRQHVGKKKPLIARVIGSLIGSPVARLIDDAELIQARTALEFDTRLLHLATEARLQGCHETAEVWLKSVTLDLRQGLGAFAAQKLLEFEQTIDDSRTAVLVIIDKRYTLLDQYRHRPRLAEEYEKSINRSLENFLGWLDGQVVALQDAVNAKIETYDVRKVALK